MVANGGHIQHTTTQGGPGRVFIGVSEVAGQFDAVTMPADLIFSADSSRSTRYPWEVESYDGVNGILIAWVKIPTVSHTIDTPFYLLYGDSATGTPQNTGSYSPANVWDANYKGVWHLPNGSTLTAMDSTASGHDGTGTNASAGTGRVDGAVSFTGSGAGYIKISAAPATSFPLTEQAWVKLNSATIGAPEVMVSQIQLSSLAAFYLAYFPPGDIRTYAQDSGATNSRIGYKTITPDTNWHHIAAIWNSATVHTPYIDGIAQTLTGYYTSGSGSPAPSGVDTTFVGETLYNTSSPYGPLGGLIDEVRISNSARGADWILTEYNNQNAPGNIGADSFIKFGAETSSGGASTLRHKVTGGE